MHFDSTITSGLVMEQNNLAPKGALAEFRFFFQNEKKIEEEIKVGKHRRVTHRQLGGSDREYKIGLCSLFEKILIFLF